MDPIKASIWYLLRFHFSEETCSSLRVFPVILIFAEYLNIYGLIYRVPFIYHVTSLYGDANPMHLSLQSFITLGKLRHKKKSGQMLLHGHAAELQQAHHTDKVFVRNRNDKGSEVR